MSFFGIKFLNTFSDSLISAVKFGDFKTVKQKKK